MCRRFKSMSKKIIIIAGRNGAGKTTFARSFLPEEAQCPRFINADLIAAGLSPFAPEAAALKAGRLMLKEMAECVRKGESFAFETTLSGLSYLSHIREWQERGYHVSLFFLSLPDAETAIARVAERVRQGGHNIPESVIRRRFTAGLRNLEQSYKFAVDAWAKYDNEAESPVLLEWGEHQRP
jgi:predicted ABC-type ATPase